ncbi:ABC transporter ATP-binding protein [Enterococcus sp. 669A]|uniref:ABC transporter ATP-binding protein n=1 Tax=Candidatus Enterococcus moelleringii TaxID=2815325 RepID=A0ABS3L551_9ENTE|nr:ABC transporter ATP-binding protein [Enterococcus sp. 669A]MBO1304746.1 ABC transporter ATP-binding protein [Enterococcus sp. 669A]
MKMVKTIGVERTFGQGDTAVHALRGINLEIDNGEFLAIVGTSGSGKSTLLHILGGLDQATKGEVIIHDANLEGLPDEELTIFRRRNIGFVFQKFNLVPILNVWENITIPVLLDKKQVDEAYINEVIQLLGLTEKIKAYPNQLSGGQQQRVAIARALANKPAILFADEPTGNLDSKTSQDVLSLLKVTSRRFKQTMVIITHDEEVAQLADRIIRLEDGEIV